MSEAALYSDEHLDIFEGHLVFKGYYLLRYGNKRVDFSSIVDFKEVRLIYFNGMSRHESNWWEARWPFDWKTKTRKEAFLVKLKGTWLPIGFSAEHPREAALLIRKKLDPLSSPV